MRVDLPKHDIIGQKPKTQWLGPGLDTITFTMWFDARYGLNPEKSWINYRFLNAAARLYRWY
nr:phage tail protein [Paenibacillus wynnii]